MNSFNFKSSVCTSRSQSEALLKLGLKPETADMCHKVTTHDWRGNEIPEKERRYSLCASYDESSVVCGFEQIKTIPAWSLHRLIEMIQDVCPQVVIIFHRVDIRSNVKRIAYSFDVCDNLYDNIIDCIEWLIKEGYFNKEYLV